MKKVRWGILGPGIIAHEFAHDFQFSQHAELAAVASRSKERGDAFARKFAVETVYTSYEDLYNDDGIDAIYVATPHNFHHDLTKDALEAGKSVLCEKPLTVNPDECRNLMKIAKETNQYLMEGVWSYFLPSILKAMEWVKEGRIGRLTQVKADFGYPVPFNKDGRMYNPDLAGGSLLDMGVYCVAMAWLFIQKDPDNFHVIARKASTGVDNDVSMLFEYDDQVANLSSAFRCKLHNYAFIIGTEGYIMIPDFWRAKEAFLYEEEQIVAHFIDNRKGFGFNFEMDAVSTDILEGRKESQIVPLETSLKLQEHMAAVMSKF